MVYPHLNHGIEIWGNSYKTGINRLQRIQNKCIKIISSTITFEHSDYVSQKLMTLKHIHEYFSFIGFFKYYKPDESQNFKMKIENYQPPLQFEELLQTNHSSFNGPQLKLPKLKTQ